MLRFWTLLIRFFCKMADFIDFETVQDDVDDAIMEVDECEPARAVSNNEFTDDETRIDKNV